MSTLRVETKRSSTGPLGRQTVEIALVEGQVPLRGCGEVWCDGSFGLPALVIPQEIDLAADGERDSGRLLHREILHRLEAVQHGTRAKRTHDLRAVGNMVATGPLMQPFRHIWTGSRVETPGRAP